LLHPQASAPPLHSLTGELPMPEIDDLDFTRPSRSEIYDPAVARACFEALGTPQSAAQGEPFFAEGQAADRMYLLLEGEVNLVRGRKTIDIAKPGEIFGELAAISQQPRSAGAQARSACRVLSLDGRQFQRAIQRTPQFALMLMSTMINRLRLTIAVLGGTGKLATLEGRSEARLFERSLLDELVAALPEHALQRFPAGHVIMREGESGVFMYVVLQGQVAISIKSVFVERIGPGSVLGEMALVDQSQRAATATAQSACALLAINRNDLLALVESKPGFAVMLLRSVADRLRYMSSHQG